MKLLKLQNYFKELPMFELIVLSFTTIYFVLLFNVNVPTSVKIDVYQTCVNNYKFVKINNEDYKQLLSENGGGIACQN